MKQIDEGKTRHFFNELDKGRKVRKRYEQFVESEEAKYKAQQEEKLLKGEDSETY